jgi:hypothetical protein
MIRSLAVQEDRMERIGNDDNAWEARKASQVKEARGRKVDTGDKGGKGSKGSRDQHWHYKSGKKGR